MSRLFIGFILIYFFQLILASDGICLGRFLDRSLAQQNPGSEVRELSRGSKSQPRGTLVLSSWGGAP